MLALDRTVGACRIPRLVRAFPTLQPSGRRLLALRWWGIYGAAIIVGTVQRVLPVDTLRFRHLGAALINLDFARVYANAWDQSGPFQLVLSYLLCLTTKTAAGMIVVHVLGNVCLVAVAQAGCRTLRREANLANSPVAELIVGIVCVAWLIPGRFWEAHPAEVVNPLLWMGAAVAARRGRASAAGILLGLSTGWEIWGALGVPVLLLLPSVRRVIGASLAFLATATALYAPFAVTGHFRLFDKVWPVVDGTSLHILFPQLRHMPWQLRLLQGAASAICAALVIARTRHKPAAIWLAPIAAVLARFVLDPTMVDYYWTPVTVLTFAGICLVSRRTTVWELGALVPLAYLPLVLYGDVYPYIFLGVGLVALLTLATNPTTARRESGGDATRRFRYGPFATLPQGVAPNAAMTVGRLPIPALSVDEQ